MSGTQALERALDILFVLAESDIPLSVPDIASRTDVPTSTVYRLLQALQDRDLIQRQERGQITLGLSVFDLARAARSQINVRLPELALPCMDSLTHRTGETSILTLPSARGAVCVEAVQSPRPIRLSYEKGRVLPLHAGASAISLLAHLEEETVEAVIGDHVGHPYADGKLITRDSLVGKLKAIREQGYAITTGEVDIGATGIGVPIFDPSGKLLAALTLAGPADRFTAGLDVLVEETIATARAIENEVKRISV